MIYELSQKFDEDSAGSPLILIELSMRDYGRLKANAIELSGVYMLDNMFAYENIVTGANISQSKQRGSICTEVDGHIASINLQQMHCNYMVIIADKSDFLELDGLDNLVVLQQRSRCCWNDEGENKFKPSDKLLLMMAK